MAEALLNQACSSLPKTVYTYRPDGLRASKAIAGGATTRYVYDGQSVVAEKNGAGSITAAYTIGKDRVISRTNYVSGSPDETQFFLYDASTNLDAIVDEEGQLVQQYTYDVFGAVRTVAPSGDPDRVGFCGGIGHFSADADDADSGLTYMRARYYDPSLGRFISEDPAGNGTNWYAYCGSNPVNFVDHTGEMSGTIGETTTTGAAESSMGEAAVPNVQQLTNSMMKAFKSFKDQMRFGDFKEFEKAWEAAKAKGQIGYRGRDCLWNTETGDIYTMVNDVYEVIMNILEI